MRHYENIYIARPDLTEGEPQEVVAKFSSIIEKNSGVIIKVDEWGLKTLAYRLKKFDKGHYVYTEFCGGPELTKEFERELKLDDRVLKYQTVKLDDNADPEAMKLKIKEAEEKVSAEKVSRETVSEEKVSAEKVSEETVSEEKAEPREETVIQNDDKPVTQEDKNGIQ